MHYDEVMQTITRVASNLCWIKTVGEMKSFDIPNFYRSLTCELELHPEGDTEKWKTLTNSSIVLWLEGQNEHNIACPRIETGFGAIGIETLEEADIKKAFFKVLLQLRLSNEDLYKYECDDEDSDDS